jgi:hypothetical protein
MTPPPARSGNTLGVNPDHQCGRVISLGGLAVNPVRFLSASAQQLELQ